MGNASNKYPLQNIGLMDVKTLLFPSFPLCKTHYSVGESKLYTCWSKNITKNMSTPAKRHCTGCVTHFTMSTPAKRHCTGCVTRFTMSTLAKRLCTGCVAHFTMSIPPKKIHHGTGFNKFYMALMTSTNIISAYSLKILPNLNMLRVPIGEHKYNHYIQLKFFLHKSLLPI